METRRPQLKSSSRVAPKRGRRALARLLFYSGLVVILTGALLWFLPIHSNWLNAHIAAKLGQALGGQARILEGRVFLGQGVYEAPALQVVFPDVDSSPTATLDCRQLLVHFSPWGLLRRDRNFLTSVTLAVPEPLKFQIDGGRVKGPDWAHHLLARNNTKAQGDLSALPEIVTVQDLAVEISGRWGDAPPLQLLNLSLTLKNETMGGAEKGIGRLVLDVSGERIGVEINPFHLTASMPPSGNRFSLEAHLNHWNAPLPGTRPRSVTLALTQGHLQGEWVRQTDTPTHWDSDLNVEMDALTISSTTGTLFNDQNIAMSIDGRYDQSTGFLDINHAMARGGQTDITLTGSWGIGAGTGLEAVARLRGAPPSLFDHIGHQGGREWLRILERSDWEAETRFAWKGRGSPLEVVSARIRADYCTGPLPDVGLTLENGAFILDYTKQRLSLRGGYGNWRWGEARLDGRIEGDVLRTSQSLQADWICSLEADLNAIDWDRPEWTQLYAQGLRVGGRMTALGRVRHPVTIGPTGHWTVGEPGLRGRMEVTSGSLNHPTLFRPLENITGAMAFNERAVTFGDLSGTVETSKAQIKGSVTGRPYFWRDSIANIAIESDLNVADTLFVLPEALREPAAQWNPSGIARARGTISGPLLRPESWGVEARIELEQVRCQPPLQGFTRPVESIEGLLTYTGASQMFRVERLTGQLGDNTFSCNGLMGDGRIDLNLQGRMDLQEAQQIAPMAMRAFDLKGVMTVEARLRTQAPEDLLHLDFRGTSPTLSVNALRETGRRILRGRRAPSPILEAPIVKPSSEEPTLWISFQGKDLTFTHQNMPEALHHIDGEIFYVDGVFYAENMEVDFGDSKDLLVRKFMFAMPREREGQLWFDVEGEAMDLTGWIQPWRTRPRGSALKLPEHLQPMPAIPGIISPRRWNLNIGGIVRAERARWRRQEVSELEVTLSHRSTPLSRCDFRAECAAQSYSGHTSASVSVSAQESEPLTWKARIATQGTQVAPLINGFRRQVNQGDTIIGRLDGNLTLGGTVGDLDSIYGAGLFSARQVSFVDNRILKGIAQVLSLGGVFNAVTFDQLDSGLVIQNKKYYLKGLRMTNTDLGVYLDGSIGFDKTLDMNVMVNPFQEMPLASVPLMGYVGKLTDFLTKPIMIPVRKIVLDPAEYLFEETLKTNVYGTMDAPNVIPAPFNPPPTVPQSPPGMTDNPQIERPTTETQYFQAPNTLPPR